MSKDTQIKIQELISGHQVVLFMKGSPDAPMCGFSAQVVQVLRLCGMSQFHHVNVLEDEEIRAGIKEYSDWPTIPQLYIAGEFIGGCDIITQMYQDGQMKPKLLPYIAA